MDIGSIVIYGLILLFVFNFLSKIVDEIFIKSLDNISEFLKLPPSVSGATFMAAGTSAPELSTTLFALFLTGANPATGLGTVVGSAIFQILVVIGFSALVKTSYLNWKPVIRDGVIYCMAILLLIFVIRDGSITFFESSMMVFGYVIYLIVLAFWSRLVKEEGEPDPIQMVEDDISAEKENKTKKKSILSYLKFITFPIDALVDSLPKKKSIRAIFAVITLVVGIGLFVLPGVLNSSINQIYFLLFAVPILLISLSTFAVLMPDSEKYKKWTVPAFIISLIFIAYGSYWLVDAGEGLALAAGIPPAIIALTILAGGTSVPEMIGSAIVSKQGRGDMAISNAIGSNAFDILMSLGLPLAIYTGINGDLTNIDAENINSSVVLLFFTMVVVLLLLFSQKFKAGKVFGGILIFTYVLYVIAAYTGILG